MTDDEIEKIFKAGSMTGRVQTLEDSHRDHESRIRLLENAQAHTDEKLDQILKKLDEHSDKKVAYIAGAICGGISLVGAVIEVILHFMR